MIIDTLQRIFVVGFGLSVVAWIPTSSATTPQPAVSPVPIPDAVVLDIALRTLPTKGRDSSKDEVDARAREVRTFLSSVGADVWFGGYQARFGIPKLIEEYKVSTLVDISAAKLGHYYLHSRLVSPEVLSTLSCITPDPTNPTSRGFCALAHWDAVIAFGDKNSLQQFRALARQFLDDQVGGRWAFKADLPQRELKAPWISALT